MNSGRATYNFAQAISAHAALPLGGIFITRPSFLFLDLHGVIVQAWAITRASCQGLDYPNSVPYNNSSWCTLRCLKFKPSFKLWWYPAWDLLESQIPVSTRGLALWISCIRSCYVTHWAIRCNRLGRFRVAEFATLWQ